MPSEHHSARRTGRLVALLMLAGVSSGCQEDLGSITAYGPGEARMDFTLDGPTNVSFVTNLEIEGTASLADAVGDFRYEISALQQGREVATARCDPLRLGSSFAESRRKSSTRLGSYRHSVTGAEITDCVLPLAAGGTTTLIIRLSQVDKTTVHIIHLELVARK